MLTPLNFFTDRYRYKKLRVCLEGMFAKYPFFIDSARPRSNFMKWTPTKLFAEFLMIVYGGTQNSLQKMLVNLTFET